MSEERRLAYVAITRAKEKLYVTSASERLLYGTTQYHRPSRFIKDEIPEHLKEKEAPARPAFGARPASPYRPHRETPPLSGEFSRPVAQASAPRPRVSAASVFAVGDRVQHLLFGKGEILSVRPMGGDTLYEIRFENGAVKKLMATYAKLKRE